MNCVDYIPMETIKDCNTCANRFCADHPSRKCFQYQEPYCLKRRSPESCEAYRDFLKKHKNQWVALSPPCQFCADVNCSMHPPIMV